MNFTALDFETADNLIPCEIGVSVVRNGIVSVTRSWLIKPSCFPYMNYWHQRVHGITNRELEKAPSFASLWDELQPYFEGQTVVAHNATFDMGVLRATLDHYQIEYPAMNYFCSVRLSRRTWKGMPSYKLNELCRTFGIGLNHHRAGSDAEACARIVLKVAESLDVSTVSELPGIHLFSEKIVRTIPK